MLDTHGRKLVEPAITKTANFLIKLGFSANQVTQFSFVIGSLAGLLVYYNHIVVALILLWLSGFLDAVDGTIARKTKPSAWGTVLDVTFDRIVEISIILALVFRHPDVSWACVILSVSIIISMTIFLTVGAVAEKSGIKSFYYQAGLAERTEGFIMFTLMIIFQGRLVELTLIFAGMILFTAFQRLREAKKILE